MGAQLHQTALTANAGTEPSAARMPPTIDWNKLVSGSCSALLGGSYRHGGRSERKSCTKTFADWNRRTSRAKR